MKLIKLLFALGVSTAIVLGGYFFVWNFIAKKNMLELQETFKSSEVFKYEYSHIKYEGYPNIVKITLAGLKLMNQGEDINFNYNLGSVVLDISPFVLKNHGKVHIPDNQYFEISNGDEKRKFKVNTSGVDFRFLDKTIRIDITGLKIIDLETDKLVVSMEKLYYTGYIDNNKDFNVTIKGLKFKDKNVKSVLLNASLNNINILEFAKILFKLATLEGQELNDYYNWVVDKFYMLGSVLNINNMKLINQDGWMEISSKIFLDSRNRVGGNIKIVSDSSEMSDYVLKLVSANQDININNMEMLQRLIKKNNNIIRLDCKFKNGYLYINNDKVTRLKPQNS